MKADGYDSDIKTIQQWFLSDENYNISIFVNKRLQTY